MDMRQFGGANLRSEMLDEGTDYPATITGVRDAAFDGDTKAVIDTSIGSIVLNKTNLRAIAEVYGWDGTAWIGKEVIVYRDMTTFGGKRTPCIRLKVEAPQPPKPTGERKRAEFRPASRPATETRPDIPF